jgi:putative FmdB family regulatory protein
MPTYEYCCDLCNRREDQVRVIAERDNPRACPHDLCAGTLRRDVLASMKPHTDTGYNQVVYSDAMGVHPSQVQEMRQKFPHHEYLDDGRAVVRSHTQREKMMRELGMHDRG